VNDTQLLAASARGDAEAFAVFYRRHLALVVGFAFRSTGDAELAADLVGEVFAAALASCARYEPRHESAAPWLMGIAENKFRESRRRGRVEDAIRRRLQIAPLPVGDDDLRRVEELGALAELDLLAVVEQLPTDQREAVRARVIEERDYGSIARDLRCSPSVVRKRVSRGLARMRARLSEQIDSEDAL
jgi:RNA polymerase sigma-70 factor (ECF subfamily)